MAALRTWNAGIGVYDAAWANGVAQGGAFLADLQSFNGVPGMCVYMIGYSAINDGGQGMWTWNSTLTSGNNTTTILPFGSVVGGWTRLGLDVP